MPSSATITIQKLINLGVISRTPIQGQYVLTRDPDRGIVRRDDIFNMFCVLPIVSATAPQLDMDKVRQYLGMSTLVNNDRPIRHMNVRPYHGPQFGNGQYQSTQDALARIAPDEDGVVRSFGIEYEIYSIPEERDRSDLLYLLDDLDVGYYIEADGSLGYQGVEIVFDPVGKDKFKEIVTTLRTFIDTHNIHMCNSDGSGAGMHITYGVSNSESNKGDIQWRLGRLACSLAAIANKATIRKYFGRPFVGYAAPPNINNLGEMSHSNCFSISGRPNTCWENRLPNYRCDPEFMIDFFRASEGVFHNTFGPSDLIKVANVFLDRE